MKKEELKVYSCYKDEKFVGFITTVSSKIKNKVGKRKDVDFAKVWDVSKKQYEVVNGKV